MSYGRRQGRWSASPRPGCALSTHHDGRCADTVLTTVCDLFGAVVDAGGAPRSDAALLHTDVTIEAGWEYLGGFWVIEADNDDDAVTWAKQASQAVRSRVEVRALHEARPA